MTTRSYDAPYLQKTDELFRQVKDDSYNAIISLENPVVLELGCGTGSDVAALAGIMGKGHVVGFDRDEEFLTIARQKNEHNKNTSFVAGDAENMPFGNASFNAIRSERVFQHLANSTKVISEAHRVLKPGGKFIIVDTDWNSLVVYHRDFVLQQKITAHFAAHHLKNGSACPTLMHQLAANNFAISEVAISTLFVRDYELTDYVFKLQYAAELAVANSIITADEKAAWQESVKEMVQHNCFAMTINVLRVVGLKA